jgi:hypothetical protein
MATCGQFLSYLCVASATLSFSVIGLAQQASRVTADRTTDMFAIQQLKSRYFRYLDTKQWAEWRKLFTDDLVFFMENSVLPSSQKPVQVGGDNFVQFVSKQLATAVTVHHGHMPDIEFTGPSTARGIWAMYDWVDNGPERGALVGYGHYHEEYAKSSDGQWRIKVLRLTRIRVDNISGSRPGGERPLPPPWSAPAK